MKLNFYHKYISPLVTAFLVTALHAWWGFSVGSISYSLSDLIEIFVLLIVTIVVSFLFNKKKGGNFDGTLAFVLKRQGISLISVFFIMYVLQFVVFGILFLAINLFSCGLPFCV